MSYLFPPFKEKEALPVCINVPVRWGDMDSFGHVNNTVFFQYFEVARIEYFQKIRILAEDVAPILASTSCRFISPITFPDQIYATAQVYKLEEFGFLMRYALYSQKTERIVASGEGRIVAYHYQEHKKVRLPTEWSQNIKALENMNSQKHIHKVEIE
jgi:acyl-CoA thioester hydrolase